MSDVALTISSCLAVMGLVAFLSWRQTRGEVASRDGYFLAGRGLSGTFIAGSLLLTNLSAEQMIGLNGAAYGFNMTSMAWEVTAAFAILLMALVFLPRYLAGAFTTLPEFLNDRYDNDVRRWTVILFLFGYGLVTIPSILYSGSLAVMQLFDVQALLNVSASEGLILTVLIVGIVGAAYAIFGGLRAVAVSDTFNGIGLLIIGALVPILGLGYLGAGDFSAGLQTVLTEDTRKLNAIGSSDDLTPFSTLFTGMIFANLFYWCTNQYVIQRTLGARSLAEGQKGVILSGFFKLAVPMFMMMPGVIAYHLYGDSLDNIDMAYPRLVKDVLPFWMTGFFLAVLLGAVFSSFNSLLNSAATLFTLDVYQPFAKRSLSDSQLIGVAKIASVMIAIFSFIVAPLLQYAPDGLWQIIRIFTGYYNIPVIAIVLAGLLAPTVPPIAAKIVIIFHVVSYTVLKFAWEIDLHFIHLYGVLFVIEMTILLAFGMFQPAVRWRMTVNPQVDMTPWRFALPVSILLVSGIVDLYLLFSPLGLVGGIDPAFWAVFAGVQVITLSFIAASWRLRDRYAAFIASRSSPDYNAPH